MPYCTQGHKNASKTTAAQYPCTHKEGTHMCQATFSVNAADAAATKIKRQGRYISPGQAAQGGQGDQGDQAAQGGQAQ
jgi:hypothetical protein